MRDDARADGHETWLAERLGPLSRASMDRALDGVALRRQLHAAADDSALMDRLRERLLVREVHREP